jgi:hypothetical protein
MVAARGVLACGAVADPEISVTSNRVVVLNFGKADPVLQHNLQKCVAKAAFMCRLRRIAVSAMMTL